ncbi:hypothetical protein [Acidiphilium multivorum]|uniref:hypothetical protein n=1 Tax=Acidiphilium multivorum TaxID=62140 RepID=UPI001B8C3497|nr:hypothetical protein [Acidiphilium multivorum]
MNASLRIARALHVRCWLSHAARLLTTIDYLIILASLRRTAASATACASSMPICEKWFGF